MGDIGTLEGLVQRAHGLGKAAHYIDGALFIGSQLPSRQEEYENTFHLPRLSMVKANILMGLVEATAFWYLRYKGVDLANHLPSGFIREKALSAAYSAQTALGFHAAAITTNALFRTGYVFAKDKSIQTLYGLRALIAFPDSVLRHSGLYNLLLRNADNNDSTRWLTAPVSVAWEAIKKNDLSSLNNYTAPEDAPWRKQTA